MRQVPKEITILDIQQQKQAENKITFLTCYDYPSAKLIHNTPNIDAILVGDSLAMVVHGYPSTVHATIDMMVLHTKAVSKGNQRAFIVADLPFLSHQGDFQRTLDDVKQLIQAGANAIKIEGACPHTLITIERLVHAGIPIIGHIGLTPQSVHQLGGHKVQGKTHQAQIALIEQAHALAHAGIALLVIECVPSELAKTITNRLTIPTIGIGAGKHTDGQIVVWHDVLGIQTTFKPKFVKHYASLEQNMAIAIQQYADDVKTHTFPTHEHSYLLEVK